MNHRLAGAGILFVLALAGCQDLSPRPFPSDAKGKEETWEKFVSRSIEHSPAYMGMIEEMEKANEKEVRPDKKVHVGYFDPEPWPSAEEPSCMIQVFWSKDPLCSMGVFLEFFKDGRIVKTTAAFDTVPPVQEYPPLPAPSSR